MKIDLRAACPERPERFDRMIDETLRKAAQGQGVHRRGMRGTAMIAALAAMLLIGALTYAATQSRIVDRLFPSGGPNTGAAKLIRSEGLTRTVGPYSLTVNEYLFDGRELHISWTARSEDDTLCLFTASDLISEAELMPQRLPGGISLDETIALGDVLLDRKIERYFHGFTVATLPEEAAKEPFEITLIGVFLRPEAPIVREDSVQESIIGRPTWVDKSSRGSPRIDYYDHMLVNDATSTRSYYAQAFHQPESPTELSAEGQLDRHLRIWSEAGFAQLLAQIELTFIVQPPDTEYIYHTAIDAPSVFEFPDYTITFTKADFTTVHTFVEAYVTPKGDTAFDKLYDHFYDMLPDGQPTDARINCQVGTGSRIHYPRGIRVEPGEHIYDWDPGPPSMPGVRVIYWGNPLPEPPEFLRFEAYWYPDGPIDMVNERANVPVRRPENDLIIKLIRTH